MNLDKDELLIKVKEAIGEEMDCVTIYKRWIESLQIKTINGNKIILIVESEEHKYNIEKRFYYLLQNCFKFVSDKMYDIEVIVESNTH